MSSSKSYSLGKAVHGAVSVNELRSLGLAPHQVIDFSANINPLGPPPGVRQALAQVNLAAYPDPECLELREALSQRQGVSSEQIVVGNGSTELIHLLAQTYLKEGGVAAILGPTFGEYEAAASLTGARIVRLAAKEKEGFLWKIRQVGEEIRRLRPQLVFLCNPNNPTGVYLPRQPVEELARSTGGGLLVLDEAYIAFVADPWPATELLALGNVVLLRSMTKDYALTGLRLGYALCPSEVAATLFFHQPAWSVNAAAQAAGLAALRDPAHLLQGVRCVVEGKAYLQRELRARGLDVLPSAANFLLVKVGQASALRARLLRQGIGVRDGASFGLPQYIRIAVRTLPENRQLIEALEEVLTGG